MRATRGQTLLQRLRGEGRGDVHSGDRGGHVSDLESGALSYVPVRQLRAHTRSREVPGAAGTTVSARRGRPGLASTGNGYARLPSW